MLLSLLLQVLLYIFGRNGAPGRYISQTLLDRLPHIDCVGYFFPSRFFRKLVSQRMHLLFYRHS